MPILIENLNALIVPVGHVNISLPVQRQTNGKFHETIEIPGKAKAENKFTITVIPFDAMVGSIRNEDGPGRFRDNLLGHVKLLLSPTLTPKFKKEISIRIKLLNPVRTGIHDPNITLRIHGHPARSFKFSW